MKIILITSSLLLSLLMSTVFAQGHEHQSSNDSEKKISTATEIAMSSGEVKKIDKDMGKIAIKHEPLNNLGMPAMTMVFRVREPAMLDKVKVEDKIAFIAEKVEGNLTVTKLEVAK